ncbi:hypothetical protein WA158_004765 [Blastocystis sp. Blastoise]
MNFVVSIVTFLKGGIHGQYDNVSSFLDELINSMEQRCNEILEINDASVRYQVVQYSNYGDKVPLVSSGMSQLNDFSYKVSNEKQKTGNGSCRECQSTCKDVNGGLIEALKEIDKLPGCTHILFVCGRDPMHNLLKDCRLVYPYRGIDLNEQYHTICETIVKRNVKVHFMPVLSKDILLSANKLREVISNNVFDGRRVEGNNYIFDEDYIVESRDNTFDLQLLEQMKNKFDQILIDEFTKSLQSM